MNKHSNKKKATCKTQIFYILLLYLLITMTLSIAVSTYLYLIKHQAKQKQSLSFQNTNKELREKSCINKCIIK